MDSRENVKEDIRVSIIACLNYVSLLSTPDFTSKKRSMLRHVKYYNPSSVCWIPTPLLNDPIKSSVHLVTRNPSTQESVAPCPQPSLQQVLWPTECPFRRPSKGLVSLFDQIWHFCPTLEATMIHNICVCRGVKIKRGQGLRIPPKIDFFFALQVTSYEKPLSSVIRCSPKMARAKNCTIWKVQIIKKAHNISTGDFF